MKKYLFTLPLPIGEVELITSSFEEAIKSGLFDDSEEISRKSAVISRKASNSAVISRKEGKMTVWVDLDLVDPKEQITELAILADRMSCFRGGEVVLAFEKLLDTLNLNKVFFEDLKLNNFTESLTKWPVEINTNGERSRIRTLDNNLRMDINSSLNKEQKLMMSYLLALSLRAKVLVRFSGGETRKFVPSGVKTQILRNILEDMWTL